MVQTRIGFWIGDFPVRQKGRCALTYEAQRQCPRE